MKKLATQDRDKLITTLQNSLYIGAKRESVEMVVSYCEIAGLDVMLKPVHIVPMNVKDPVTEKYSYRDVIMPGIGLYRIQAARSNDMAGVEEPEFGPDITADFTDKNKKSVSLTFPEWCKVSVKKIVGDNIVEYIAKEYWIENYATDSGKSSAPNKMWRKRPRGQIAKCAEAQALRKGWPEVGQAPTAEEMAGKEIDMGTAERVDEPTALSKPAELPEYPADKFESTYPKWRKIMDDGKKTPEQIIATISSKYRLSEDQIKTIKHVTTEPNQNEEFLNDYEQGEIENANA